MADGTNSDAGRTVVALDLMRGIAAIAVAINHIRGALFVDFGALPASNHTPWVALLYLSCRLGHIAVVVFFVLSGFLVGGQIIRRVRENRFDVLEYGLDRATRILIPLIPACALTAAIMWQVSGHAPPFSQTALNMIGLNDVLTRTLPINPPLWTLAYEIWFYVLGGAAAYLLVGGRHLSIAALVLILGFSVFTILAPHYLLFWLIGALAVTLLPSRHAPMMAAAGLLLFVGGTVCWELSSGSRSFANVVLLPSDLSENLACAGISLTIPYLCQARTNAYLSFIRAPANYLSSISYSLYLFHCPVLAFLVPVFPKATQIDSHSLLNFLAALAIIFAAANLFYFCFEARTPYIRRNLRRDKIAAAVPAFAQPSLLSLPSTAGPSHRHFS